jgi:guanylate kinase
MSNETAVNMDRLGNLLVITAPSGAGKSTLVSRLRQSDREIAFSVSYTTRAARPNEQHSREYFFVSIEEFEAMRERGEFLEYAKVHNHYYATHRESVRRALEAGRDIVLDIDVQGAEQIRRLMPQAVLIFIMPPSFTELSDRLRNRGQDSPEVIERRLSNATDEVARYKEFDYVIINDDLEMATAALIAIARAERYRPNRIEQRILSILSSFRKE